MRTRVQIGVSPICHGPTDFASAFDDTSRMLELARSLKIARPVITADDVRLHRLLLGLSRPAEALALSPMPSSSRSNVWMSSTIHNSCGRSRRISNTTAACSQPPKTSKFM
jgi:sugar diacid utilization regulator